jgi:hypothetical protein
MSKSPIAADEPHEPGQGVRHRRGELLLVPVRAGGVTTTLRLFRSRSGRPTAVAFTTEERLKEVLGDEQPWVRLDRAVLPSLTGPLGVRDLIVDPGLIAAAPAPLERATPFRTPRTEATV